MIWLVSWASESRACDEHERIDLFLRQILGRLGAVLYIVFSILGLSVSSVFMYRVGTMPHSRGQDDKRERYMDRENAKSGSGDSDKVRYRDVRGYVF